MSDNHPQLMGLGNQPVSARSSASSILQMPPGASAACTRGGSAGATASGEVQHVSYLSEHIGALYMNDDFSDIRIIVEECQFPAHRVVLAARSEYFRAMLYGGMRETREETIELLETTVGSFRALLKYIYTGKVSLSNQKEEQCLEILGLAHKYGFAELEAAVSEYLKAVLNARNLCTVFGASHLYSLRSLGDYCLDFADKHATEILSTPGFLNLSAGAVEQLISRDSFCAKEIDIFRAVREWSRLHPETKGVDSLIAQLRLPLMKLDDLLNTVRPSGLLPSDIILDAIKEQNENRPMELKYRGFLLPGVNVATTTHGAAVLEGELKSALLNGDTQNYDLERGFTRHPIDPGNPGIVVHLGMQCIVNHIRLLLWDRDPRSYSYYVEVSIDGKDWVRVVDHSSYLCRSHQRLYFSAKVVRYIRVVGTHNSVNRVFHLVSLEAMYVADVFQVDDKTGLPIPFDNVATISESASVIEGVSRSRNALINGDTAHYDWDSGYTCHQLGSGAIVVQLPQPYLVDSMRLLLWDCDDRHYSFLIEVSNDQQTWHRVADKTQQQCKSWQLLQFERQPVTFVRIVGTYNSANEVFHCVHFECPASRSALVDQADGSAAGVQMSAGGQLSANGAGPCSSSLSSSSSAAAAGAGRSSALVPGGGMVHHGGNSRRDNHQGMAMMDDDDEDGGDNDNADAGDQLNDDNNNNNNRNRDRQEDE